jgi:hypothetical protein
MRRRHLTLVTILLVTSLAGIPARAQKIETAELMRQMFGNYDARTHRSIWIPPSVPARYAGYFNDGRGRTSIEYDVFFKDSGKAKRLLVFSTVPDSNEEYICHACAVLLSAAIFPDGEARPEARSDFLEEGGAWGEAPGLTLQAFGKRHVLQIDDSDVHGGVETGSVALFAEEKSTLRQILELRAVNDNSDLDICAVPKSSEDKAECVADAPYCLSAKDRKDKGYRESCTSWRGLLTADLQRSSGSWPDLVYSQQIIAAAPGAFPPRPYRTQFRFIDGVYKPVGPPSGGPRIDLAYYSEN